MVQYEIIKKKGDLNSGFEVLGFNITITLEGKEYELEADRIDFDLPKLKDPKRLKEWERYKWWVAKNSELDKLREELERNKEYDNLIFEEGKLGWKDWKRKGEIQKRKGEILQERGEAEKFKKIKNLDQIIAKKEEDLKKSRASRWIPKSEGDKIEKELNLLKEVAKFTNLNNEIYNFGEVKRKIFTEYEIELLEALKKLEEAEVGSKFTVDFVGRLANFNSGTLIINVHYPEKDERISIEEVEVSEEEKATISAKLAFNWLEINNEKEKVRRKIHELLAEEPVVSPDRIKETDWGGKDWEGRLKELNNIAQINKFSDYLEDKINRERNDLEFELSDDKIIRLVKQEQEKTKAESKANLLNEDQKRRLKGGQLVPSLNFIKKQKLWVGKFECEVQKKKRTWKNRNSQRKLRAWNLFNSWLYLL